MANDTGKAPIIPLEPNARFSRISMQQERFIGRVVASWSLLESTMQTTIWTMLGVDLEDGRILTARADANRKIQWLSEFAKKHLTGTELTEMKIILAQISALRLDRNFVAHGVWSQPWANGGQPVAWSFRESGDDQSLIVGEAFPHERMEALWTGILEAGRKLEAWNTKHAASRKKPLEP